MRGFCGRCGRMHARMRRCSVALRRTPESATACNCTACRRYGTLWAYDYEDAGIHVSGSITAYVRGDSLGFHFCPTCGCVAYWRRRRPMMPGGAASLSTSARPRPSRSRWFRSSTSTASTSSRTSTQTVDASPTTGSEPKHPSRRGRILRAHGRHRRRPKEASDEAPGIRFHGRRALALSDPPCPGADASAQGRPRRRQGPGGGGLRRLPRRQRRQRRRQHPEPGGPARALPRSAAARPEVGRAQERGDGRDGGAAEHEDIVNVAAYFGSLQPASRRKSRRSCRRWPRRTSPSPRTTRPRSPCTRP